MKSLSIQSFKTVRRVIAAMLMCGLGGVLVPAAAQAYQLNTQEQQLAGIFTSASGQHRPSLTLDPVLSQVARARAADMAARNYFDHVNPDGHGPNYLVRQAGYQLPSWWGTDPQANNIESIAGGYSSASDAWNAWMNSPPHRAHLLAEDSFYTNQTNYGVGYAYDSSSTYKYYWVIITAPPEPKPLLVIQAPAKGAMVTDSTVTATGTSDTASVDHVEWRVENAAGTGTYQNAAGIAQWSAQVTGLVPGPNVLRVRSVGAAGNVIATASVSFLQAVYIPLTVNVDGAGSVSAGFSGTTQRLDGMNYTIQATPARGWFFAGWTGSAGGKNPALTFTMQDGLELTANFIPNPYRTYAGSFQGLVNFHGQPANMRMTLGAGGAFSGRLALANGNAFAFAGGFNSRGIARLSIAGRSAVLVLDVNTGAVSLLLGGQPGAMEHTAAQTAALAGRYHVALSGSATTTGTTCPQGTGFAVVTVAANGRAWITGRLGDATAFSGGATLSNDGTLPVFVSLFHGAELTAGYLDLSDTNAGITGRLAWTRSANPRAVLYPAGFNAAINVTGSAYGTNADPQAALANSTLTLGGGGLGSDIVDNIVSGTLPDGVSLDINAATGVVTGQFTSPSDNQPRAFAGLVLPGQNGAFGLFVGPGETGYVSVVAR